MKKKLFITTGSLLAVSLPLSAVVSCGTSWHKWNHTSAQDPKSLVQNPDKSNIESVNPNKPKSVTDNKNVNVITTKDLFAIRPIDEIKAAAFVNDIINLNEVKNQFELNALLVDLVKIKSPKSIENYWRSSAWTEFTTFLSGVEETKDINLKYTDTQGREHNSTVKWDISSSKDAIIKGLLDTNHFVDIEAKEQEYYDAVKGVLTDDGFSLAKQKAIDLVNIPVVESLKTVSLDYAIHKLALLVNLPVSAFGGFKKLLTDIGQFTSQLFDVDDAYVFKNEMIKYWVSQKHLKPNIFITDIDNKARYPKGLIEGAFLLQAVSREYDDLGR